MWIYSDDGFKNLRMYRPSGNIICVLIQNTLVYSRRIKFTITIQIMENQLDHILFSGTKAATMYMQLESSLVVSTNGNWIFSEYMCCAAMRDMLAHEHRHATLNRFICSILPYNLLNLDRRILGRISNP